MCDQCAFRNLYGAAMARYNAMPWWKRVGLKVFYRSPLGAWWADRQDARAAREFERITGISLDALRDRRYF